MTVQVDAEQGNGTKKCDEKLEVIKSSGITVDNKLNEWTF